MTPVLASRVVAAGGSPAGVVDPNEKPPVLGAAGVVEPNIEGVDVDAEAEFALVEVGGAAQLKLGVLAAAVPVVFCAFDAPNPAKPEGVLPDMLLAALFPKPLKPPVAPLVPKSDGVLVPVALDAPKFNLGGSDILGSVI